MENIQYLKKESLSQCKRRCKAIARDLKYGDEILDAIRCAKSNDEINQIMIDARRRQE